MRFKLLTISLLFFCSLHALDKEKFHKMVSNPPPEWMLHQIQEDLSHFKKSDLSSDKLESYHHEYAKFSHLKVKIQDGRITAVKGKAADALPLRSARCEIVINFLEALNHTISLPNAEFLVHVTDKVNLALDVPFFVFSKVKDHKYILIPDDVALKGGFLSVGKEILAANKTHPWSSKKEKMFWRGSASGVHSDGDWREYARAKLALLSKGHPSVLNAKIVTPPSFKIVAEMRKQGLMGKYTSLPDHLNYKYLIDVDGWSTTWPRCFWILLSNSVMLKQETENTQWFYKGIVPYKHYVPLKADLSDIFEKYQWMRKNDALSHEIAKEATRFAMEELSEEAIYYYFYLVIKEYAKLQQGA